MRRSDLARSYRGWTIWPPNIHGMWSATRAGHLSYAADTLAGIKAIIRDDPRKTD